MDGHLVSLPSSCPSESGNSTRSYCASLALPDGRQDALCCMKRGWIAYVSIMFTLDIIIACVCIVNGGLFHANSRGAYPEAAAALPLALKS